MEGEMEKSENEAVASQKEEKFGKDALLVAGAVLLASLIIAGAIIAGAQRFSLVGSTSNTNTDVVTDDTTAPAPTTVTVDQVKALFNKDNIVFGNKDSKVLFVEFSDPSCPYCHVAAGKNPNLNKQIGAQFTLAQDGGTYVPPVPEMKKLVDAGKAVFVWLYANGHGNGEMGTKAMYCAYEKKKFWEAHDLLMSEAGYTLLNTTVKNDKTKYGVMADFLKNVVSAKDMQTCLESGKYDKRITYDMAIARQFGFSGTPSFFVNAENFKGAYSFKDMQASIDKYLQ